jgi:hypothetical protein
VSTDVLGWSCPPSCPEAQKRAICRSLRVQPGE